MTRKIGWVRWEYNQGIYVEKEPKLAPLVNWLAQCEQARAEAEVAFRERELTERWAEWSGPYPWDEERDPDNAFIAHHRDLGGRAILHHIQERDDRGDRKIHMRNLGAGLVQHLP